MSIIKVVTDNDDKSTTKDMLVLDGYTIKKVEYIAEQEMSTTKQTTTHTDMDGNIIGYESMVLKTSAIRLIPDINIDKLREKSSVLEKKDLKDKNIKNEGKTDKNA
ncbi:MAG: hypothetical protein WC554_02980 [Clostridia bacterium]|jgi:hypothetical protein